MDLQLTPYNARASLGVGDVTPISFTSTGKRAAAPYPPGNVEINGDPWPDGGDVSGDAVLTWAHRIRTAQIDKAVVHQDAASVSGRIEGSYTVEVYVNNVLISARTTTGITGTTFTYTAAQRVSDDANAAHLVKFRITPVNADGVEGTPRTTDSFHMV